MAELRKSLILLLMAIFLVGCETPQSLPKVSVTQPPASMKPMGQENTTSVQMPQLILGNIMVLNSSIDLITTHGDMATAYSNPHITQTNPQQFIVILKDIKPGNYAINQKILFDTGIASDLVILPDNKGLKLVFTLRKKVASFLEGIAGGTHIGFQFS